MRLGRRQRLAAAVVGALLLVAAGCGGDDATSRREAAGAYAGEVRTITSRSGERLARLADGASYRDGRSAAASTRDYASGIRAAATELRRAQPPEAVRAQHRSLVALYDATARSLVALAARFDAARDPVALAALAQELSSQIQRYATSEQQLRVAIQRTLDSVSATAPG